MLGLSPKLRLNFELVEGILRSDGSFRFIGSDDGQEKVETGYIRPEFRKGSSQDLIVPLVRRLVTEGKSAIVFRETKGEARGCFRYLAEALRLGAAQGALDALPTRKHLNLYEAAIPTWEFLNSAGGPPTTFCSNLSRHGKAAPAPLAPRNK
jgi:hypothetical protein